MTRTSAIAGVLCWVARLAAAADAPLEVPPEVLKAEAERIAVIGKAKDCVLAIFSAAGGGGGSGVVISADGYALSNFHVAMPTGPAMKCGMADGRLYDAVVVGLDPTGDVALIKLFGRDDFPHAELADSDQVRPGDSVFAMGNPFLLATDFQPTATWGIISGVHRYQFPAGTLLEYTDCLQTDASINPGNSGGPLFDARGRLIGINGRASFEKRGRVSVGVGYAISINQVRNFLGCLHSGRIVDHATLGATVGLDDQRRLVVTDVLDTSDAYRRGLRYGDEILAFGGRTAETPNAFKNVLGIFPKGWRVPLSYRHDGKRFDVLVRLAGVHSEDELLAKLSGRGPRAPMPIPKPGDRPGEKPGGPRKPPDRDDDSPEPKPGELPIPAAKPKPPLPDIVRKHFDEKRGYANYYFNRLHRDRVWKAWNARGDFAGQDRAWLLAGTLARGDKFSLSIAGSQVLLSLPRGDVPWSVPEELGSSLEPVGSGGLFAALSLWRRLAVEGLDKFGEVTYLGTAPLAGHPGLLDVLVGRHGGVECRYYFDVATGLLAGLEMAAHEHADPCELHFTEYRESEGRWIPRRIEVRCGDEPVADFRVDSFRLSKPEPP
jgi:S1-C subfamily serine protease